MDEKATNGVKNSILLRHQVTILDTDEIFFCFEKKHLLEGMAVLGKRGIPSGCHGGGCGVCKIQITKGNFETIVMSRAHISIEEQAKNITLACRTFPRSDIELKVIGKLAKNVQRDLNKKPFSFY